MVATAAINAAQSLALVLGIVGLSGVVFTALRFRRDDTTAVVTQQSQITAEMKTLNDELRLAVERLRKERDACHDELRRVSG